MIAMYLATSLLDILLLADWNTRVVVIGTSMLGVAAGVVGAFLVLRKRALLGDTVSHAMLPGVVGAFLVMQAFGGGGKSFAGLLLGAAIAGVLAAWAIPVLRRATGLKDDAIIQRAQEIWSENFNKPRDRGDTVRIDKGVKRSVGSDSKEVSTEAEWQRRRRLSVTDAVASSAKKFEVGADAIEVDEQAWLESHQQMVDKQLAIDRRNKAEALMDGALISSEIDQQTIDDSKKIIDRRIKNDRERNNNVQRGVRRRFLHRRRTEDAVGHGACHISAAAASSIGPTTTVVSCVRLRSGSCACCRSGGGWSR